MRKLTDLWDLGIGVFLLVLLVLGGMIAQKFGFLDIEGGDLGKFKIEDSKELFLLSYLKMNTDNGRIYDLILDAENDEESFGKLMEETNEVMGFGFAREYDVRILYPSGEKRLGNGEFEEYQEIKVPSKNRGVILVKLGIDFREDWI